MFFGGFFPAEILVKPKQKINRERERGDRRCRRRREKTRRSRRLADLNAFKHACFFVFPQHHRFRVQKVM